MPSRMGKIRCIVEALAPSTGDELDIAVTFVSKLMGEGRTEHGPLDLATDKRDLMAEAKDELDDTISYLLMHRKKLELMR